MALPDFLKRLLGSFTARPISRIGEPSGPQPPNPHPYFRFYPGCYEDGTLQQSDNSCVTCGEAGRWMFNGNIYSVCNDKPVCAGCISEDRLKPHYGADFSLYDIDFASDAGQYEQEVMQRTPGFPMFNPITWPVEGGIPMAYLGVGDESRFWDDLDCKTAMQDFWREETGQELDGPTTYIFVFRTLDNSRFGFVIDLD